MKILYRQPAEAGKGRADPLFDFGLEECYLKQISLDADVKRTTKKEHSHTCYEIHLTCRGRQVYETEDGVFDVGEGQFLIIPSGKRHRLISYDENTEKISFTFVANASELPFERVTHCAMGKVPSEVEGSIGYILSERRSSLALSERLVAGRVLESIVLLLRQVCDFGYEAEAPVCASDARVDLAKQYIHDNICTPLSVSDVAEYCYVCEKQLSRLFYKFEGISPASYIRRERIRHIEALLSDTELSLREISNMMNFTNEYYFNSFFKKNYGMPPGQYRKMI